jgi:hypothetical protein
MGRRFRDSCDARQLVMFLMYFVFARKRRISASQEEEEEYGDCIKEGQVYSRETSQKKRKKKEEEGRRRQSLMT